MTLEMANFDKVANGVKTSDRYIADNGQHIVNLYNVDQEYNVGDVVCTIPLDAVKYCRTEEDLSQYGKVPWNSLGSDDEYGYCEIPEWCPIKLDDEIDWKKKCIEAINLMDD